MSFPCEPPHNRLRAASLAEVLRDYVLDRSPARLQAKNLDIAVPERLVSMVNNCSHKQGSVRGQLRWCVLFAFKYSRTGSLPRRRPYDLRGCIPLGISRHASLCCNVFFDHCSALLPLHRENYVLFVYLSYILTVAIRAESHTKIHRIPSRLLSPWPSRLLLCLLVCISGGPSRPRRSCPSSRKD